MIQARGLTKHYGQNVALHDVTCDIHPGRVTGFLGPNGAGKSTSMRLMVGLDRPTAGTVTVNGKRYADHASPLRVVGTLLDARGVHPGRSARSHLRSLAATHGIPDTRVDEVLAIVGLTQVARRRVGGFSLGMGQRLGIAAALLGDPEVLILDEPVNGLDPDGVLWVRELLRGLAAEGRTVLISSHLMSEMAHTADHIIVLGRGTVVADAAIGDFVAQNRPSEVSVTSPDAPALAATLLDTFSDIRMTPAGDDAFVVAGVTAADIGDIAAEAGIVLHELRTITSTLEAAYLESTRRHLEYQGA